MSKTLLQKIKDKEVTQVYNDMFGVSKRILLDENQETYEIFVEFEDGSTETFTSEGFVVYKAINANYDIRPYNAPESVQEIKMPTKNKMPDPDAIPPQPTIEEFAEWVENYVKKYYCHSFISDFELIELFKQQR